MYRLPSIKTAIITNTIDKFQISQNGSINKEKGVIKSQKSIFADHTRYDLNI